MDGTGVPGTIRRRGRQGDGMMRGVTGPARGGLVGGRWAPSQRKSGKRYLRAALPTSGALSMGGARLSEALARYPRVAMGSGGVGAHGR